MGNISTEYKQKENVGFFYFAGWKHSRICFSIMSTLKQYVSNSKWISFQIEMLKYNYESKHNLWYYL